MRRVGLVEQFALRSLVVIGIGAVLLGLLLSWIVRSAAMEEASRATRVLANAIIVHNISESTFDELVRTQDHDEFERLIRSDLEITDIVAVKLWDRDGVMVYSTDSEDPVGTSFADKREVALALSGQTASKVVTSEGEEESSAQFRKAGVVMEVYAPLVFSPGAEPAGVFEVYQHYAPALAQLRRAYVAIWGLILLGGAVTYAMQVSMVRGVENRLKASEAETEEINSRLESSLREIEEYSLGTLQALTSAVDAKDTYTASHSLNVTDYAVAIGRRLRLSEREIVLLERASLLHDIGKIGVPEAVLLKPSCLDDAEFALVKEHSEMGARIIASIPFLSDLVPLIRHHHEHWNGGGYPDGMKGKATPRLSRVLAVADAFDAMISDRPYRSGMRVAAARQEILRCRGIQFDPEAVDALLAALDGGDLGLIGVRGPERHLKAVATA